MYPKDIKCGMSDCDYNVDDFCTHRIDNIIPNCVLCPSRKLFWRSADHKLIDQIRNLHSARVAE